MLENLIKLFAINREDFNNLIFKESSENIKFLFEELIKQYFNDLNSSTLREMVTCEIAGFKHKQEKLGYDGIKITNKGDEKYCEVKPRNYIIGHTNNKLNGGGNFTDFSWKKFERFSEENPSILISGFINGELIYIIEFDFNNQGFRSQLEKQLLNHFPNGDKNGFWLRSANFSFKHFKDYDYKKIYINKNIDNYKDYLIGDLFAELKK